MIFSFHPQSGEINLSIEGELFTHLIKARRHKVGDELDFSCLDGKQHQYKVIEIGVKKATLTKLSTQAVQIKPPQFLHLAWCVVDTQTVKTFLPYLNQLGLAKITFVMADRSQKNFKPNVDKLQKSLIYSCGQCGRYDLMQLDTSSSIDAFIEKYPQTVLLNFNGIPLAQYLTQHPEKINTIMVGAEGGFSPRELLLFINKPCLSINTPYLLKSENAALLAVSQLLL